MNTNELKTRSEMSDKYKWNIEAMYPDENEWHRDIEKALEKCRELESMKGHIADSPSSLLRSIKTLTETMRRVENAFVYARMRRDEDNSNPLYLEMTNKAFSVFSEISARSSFFTPELLEADPDTVRGYIDSEPELTVYSFMIETTLRKKLHVLDTACEELIAKLSEVIDAPSEAFNMLNNVDMSFGTVKDADGKSAELTHGNFISFLESESREVRRTAYEKLYKEFEKHNNTLSVLYNYAVKTDSVVSGIRNHGSSLEAALYGDNIPLSVYESLISAVHKSLPAMHRYTAVRKSRLAVDELKMFDMYVPITGKPARRFTFEEAVETACGALYPLGEEYVETLRIGLTEKRWIDVFENKGKTSGAYSFGSYDSMPYMLMNFTGELRDVFTLIHESGHSMHSCYTRKNQPFIYGGHSIFTAEIASTVNETLLINHLLDNTDDADMQAYLINFYIDQFKSTLFRQTMFAEFERIAHERVEKGGALTSDYLNAEYDRLNSLYYGSALSKDDYIKYEWSRIPHFYRSYYVYQYATGFSAAQAIAKGLLSGDKEKRQAYLQFLSSGDSDYPIELLKKAGIDMSSEKPVIDALNIFDELVRRLEEIL